ncbi:hypothetical protein IQ244_05245 [Nostoc sp. LEGE 06077]|uniref:hypothetical protein n=1 Tax=Nostoc sp. LEGE 06077 TaxID=915325 RepID=UPI001881F1AC|nr:hypothetical protein [Nostoc sp. LEGE 06077]MBE9205926.1 hypothetical protein [Nostoc sp. LEGE 06077]
MQSQETEPTVLDSQILPELYADLSKEIYSSLNHDKLVQLLEKYGLSDLESFQLQFLIDLSQVKSSQENQGILPSITPPKVKLQCYYQNGQWYSCGFP